MYVCAAAFVLTVAATRPAPPPPPQLPRGLPEVETDCEGADLFGGTALEKGGWCLLRQWRFAGMRTVADATLERDPNSYRAQMLMGVAFHLGEGNLPRALHHLQASEALFLEQESPHPIANSSPWFVHRITLLELQSVCGEMNLHPQQIAYVDLLRTRLDLNYVALKAWPLVKMRQWSQARAAATEAMALPGDDNKDQREDGVTALCAVESEQQNRHAAYQACRASAAPHLAGDENEGAVTIMNAAVAAAEVLKYDEAERLLLEATQRKVEGTINPWGHLTHLYVRQGRFAEALDALREMFHYRAQRPPHLAQQDQAQADLTGAAVLLLAGKTAEAEQIATRVAEQPERLGANSAAPEQHLAANLMMARAAHAELASSLADQAWLHSWSERLGLWARALRHRFSAWWAGRQASQLLANQHLLVSTFRPECPGSVELPVWLRGDMASVVGGGVALAALERARAAETLPPEQSAGYFDALEAEAHMVRGDHHAALQAAERALEGLPRTEVLLRTRVAVVGSAAALGSGRANVALALAEEAVRVDPGMFRRLGAQIPVHILAEGEAAQRAADLLAGSSLLRMVPWGLPLRLGPQAVSLEQADGTIILDARVAAGNDDDKESLARRIAAGVYGELLHPRLDVTQADIRSLDGGMGGHRSLSQQTESVLDLMFRPSLATPPHKPTPP